MAIKKKYTGPERRQFVRLKFTRPLAFKVCKKKTLSRLLRGYTHNVSQSGLLCNMKDKVTKGATLWLSFDRNTLDICERLEKQALIYQSGIIGKVVRVIHKPNGSCDVGIQFLTRKEKNFTNIYPKIHFVVKLEK